MATGEKEGIEGNASVRFADQSIKDSVTGTITANLCAQSIPRAKLTVNFSDPVAYVIDSSSLARLSFHRSDATKLRDRHKREPRSTTGWLRAVIFKFPDSIPVGTLFHRAMTPGCSFCVALVVCSKGGRSRSCFAFGRRLLGKSFGTVRWYVACCVNFIIRGSD